MAKNTLQGRDPLSFQRQRRIQTRDRARPRGALYGLTRLAEPAPAPSTSITAVPSTTHTPHARAPRHRSSAAFRQETALVPAPRGALYDDIRRDALAVDIPMPRGVLYFATVNTMAENTKTHLSREIRHLSSSAVKQETALVPTGHTTAISGTTPLPLISALGAARRFVLCHGQ